MIKAITIRILHHPFYYNTLSLNVLVTIECKCSENFTLNITIEVHKKHIRNNNKVNVTIMTNIKFKIFFVYIILEFLGI